jgi:quercetin dioxygenase-like cupin family protein
MKRGMLKKVNSFTGGLTRINADIHEIELREGDSVRQLPGQPHQLEAVTDGIVFEVSTQHFDYDSYRVLKGDSNKPQ